jgi:hypothetical protein
VSGGRSSVRREEQCPEGGQQPVSRSQECRNTYKHVQASHDNPYDTSQSVHREDIHPAKVSCDAHFAPQEPVHDATGGACTHGSSTRMVFLSRVHKFDTAAETRPMSAPAWRGSQREGRQWRVETIEGGFSTGPGGNGKQSARRSWTHGSADKARCRGDRDETRDCACAEAHDGPLPLKSEIHDQPGDTTAAASAGVSILYTCSTTELTAEPDSPDRASEVGVEDCQSGF